MTFMWPYDCFIIWGELVTIDFFSIEVNFFLKFPFRYKSGDFANQMELVFTLLYVLQNKAWQRSNLGSSIK